MSGSGPASNGCQNANAIDEPGEGRNVHYVHMDIKRTCKVVNYGRFRGNNGENYYFEGWNYLACADFQERGF